MGGGTQSSNSSNRPLTAAERQDLYRGGIGNVLNTYKQSGLPYGGQGSMDAAGTQAVFDPNQQTPQPGQSGWSGGYNANSTRNSNPNKLGEVTLDPKTFMSAGQSNTTMPTGGADPGGINVPVYNAGAYQSPGAFQSLSGGDYQNLQDKVLAGYTAPLDAAKATDMRDVNSDAAKRGVWSSGLAMQAENDIAKAYAPQYAAAGGAATSQTTNLQAQELAGRNAFNQAGANAANAFNQSNAQNQFSAGWAPLNYLQNQWAGTAGNVGGSNSFGMEVKI